MYYVCDAWPIKCVVHIKRFSLHVSKPTWTSKMSLSFISLTLPAKSFQVLPSLAARNKCTQRPSDAWRIKLQLVFPKKCPTFISASYFLDGRNKNWLQMHSCIYEWLQIDLILSRFEVFPLPYSCTWCTEAPGSPMGPSGPDWTKIGCERSLCQMTDITRAC